MTHSTLYLRTSANNSPALLFVYRHHVPSISHLDAASLLGFLAEICRVQGQAKEFIEQHLQAPWVQLFGGSEHLWCQLGPLPAGIEAAALQGQLPDLEHLAALRQALAPPTAASDDLAQQSAPTPGQLSLLDLL